MIVKTDNYKTNKEGSFLSNGGFPLKMGAPAMRALANAGYTRLEQLAVVREDEVKKLHGIGPHALKLLTQALHDLGLSFNK
jgi:hypothetical protein